MNVRTIQLTTIATIFLVLHASGALAQDMSGEKIGRFTGVKGEVTVIHPDSPRVFPVSIHDQVLFHDTIETQHKSRTKAFLDDDSILTVGENSLVEITEHMYNPDQNLRRVVARLFMGKLRALVGKVFTGSGSKFEIHTPTAVAAARGTYFVVWMEDDVTGAVNIGDAGRVDFTSEGKTVTLDPGEYSLAKPGESPTQPVPYGTGSAVGDSAVALTDNPSGVLTTVTSAITGTILNDSPLFELPQQIVHALHRAIPENISGSLNEGPLSGSVVGGQKKSIPRLSDMQAQSGVPSTSIGQGGVVGAVTSGVSVPTVPVTPPAVISGATNGSGLGLPLP